MSFTHIQIIIKQFKYLLLIVVSCIRVNQKSTQLLINIGFLKLQAGFEAKFGDMDLLLWEPVSLHCIMSSILDFSEILCLKVSSQGRVYKVKSLQV